jgi:UDP-N-acetylmuramate dehydrogenase
MQSQPAQIQDWPLPEVRGKYLRDVALADLCWFRVGGTADVVFMPADVDDLSAFLAALPDEVPLHILGAGSNTLVRDGGVRGVVLRLGAAFGQVTQTSQTHMLAGAATLDVKLARAAADVSLSGLEFYRGIPGAIGGAIAMNAGAYGGETSDVLVEVEALDRAGNKHVFSADDLQLSYRHNGYSEFLVYTGARFEATPGDRPTILAAMQEISAKREQTQPIKSRTGGSTFKNPGGANPQGPKAWKLIDAAGARGLQVGDAQISELHCNFMINHGQASAADLENLGEQVRTLVAQASGEDLHWEIKRIGEAV